MESPSPSPPPPDSSSETPSITDSSISTAVETLDASLAASDKAANGTDAPNDDDEDDGDDENDENPRTVKATMAALQRHSDGTNVVKETLTTFSMSESGDRKGDVIVKDMTTAMSLLKDMIEAAKDKEKSEKASPSSASSKASSKKKKSWIKRKGNALAAEATTGTSDSTTPDADADAAAAAAAAASMWEFRSTPYEEFGKTLDETLTAFLMWARPTPSHSDNDNDADAATTEKPESKSDDGSPPSSSSSSASSVLPINVSKAFRRLETYAHWMEYTGGEEIRHPPLTRRSVESALRMWAMRIHPDSKGRLVWWIDLCAMDRKAIKKTSATDHVRMCVWYAHAVLYHPRAQEDGMIFVENCDKVGLVQMVSLLPMKVSAKLDRLFIGVLPLKMHAVYIFEIPAWMNVLMKLIGMFMSAKMKGRIVMLKDWTSLPDLVGGDQYIPKGFGKAEGTADVPLIPDVGSGGNSDDGEEEVEA